MSAVSWHFEEKQTAKLFVLKLAMHSFLRTSVSNNWYLVLTLSYLSVEALNFGLMTASFLCAVPIDLVWIVAESFLKHLGHSVASRVADLR